LIIVDSAVWAEWINGSTGAFAKRLERAIASSEELGLTPLILTEVLQGLRDDRAFEFVRNTLLGFPILRLDDGGHVEAAKLFRKLRRAGITVRGAVDVLIAQTCLENGCEVLSPDRDFDAIARHSGLKLCAV
jgi:predicted nucleic acid-binding protein